MKSFILSLPLLAACTSISHDSYSNYPETVLEERSVLVNNYAELPLYFHVDGEADKFLRDYFIAESILEKYNIKLRLVGFELMAQDKYDESSSHVELEKSWDQSLIHVYYVKEAYTFYPESKMILPVAGLYVDNAFYQRDWIVISDSSERPTTLTHEIGHHLGLDHSYSKDNLMYSGDRNENASFTNEQGNIMFHGAIAFLLSGNSSPDVIPGTL